MADMFLSPIMDKLISAGFTYLKDQATWHKRMEEEKVKLYKILPQIKAVVHFASGQEQIAEKYPDLNKWLWQLRDAIDDAYDVADELEYIELQKQVNKNKKPIRVRFIMKSMKKRLIKIVKRALKIDPTKKRLEEAVQELCRLSTNVAFFYDLVKDAKQEHLGQQRQLYRAGETGSLPKNDLIGRGKHKEDVIEWLRKPSNELRGTTLYGNISLLSIVGMGGMGKTTLLQHVYQHEIAKTFDLKMWVCVSNNFDVKKVIADMLESLKKKERPRLDTLDALQGRLKEEVMDKKFLLVLDDVWEEEEERDKNKWEDVLAPLASGAFGSKILLTTRSVSVALMFEGVIKKKTKIVKLEGLEDDECLQLLNYHAFAGVENPNNDHENLRDIAQEIVKKLLRSPLAAKVIGGVLYSLNLDERRWREVLESNLLARDSINSILTLSYIVLPNHLRNCFAICCMFPEDHRYDKDDIVRMWISLGFIQSSSNQTMEDIGGRYFDALVKKALFDELDWCYKMHDLIHESASKFFEQECGKLVDNEDSSSKVFEVIRHLSVRNAKPDILRKIENFKHLHSLFLFYEFEDSDEHIFSSLIQIFKALTNIRLLYIDIPNLKIVPEEIGNLIHLRYLYINDYGLIMLPKPLSNLYHLQYLICSWQDKGADFLSSNINNLSNLRYMKLHKNCTSSICGIGKLKYLQEVNMFDLRDVNGYKIGEFENMNYLCKLGINCLENVKNVEEACSAKLCAKTRLTYLTLWWSNTDSSRNNNSDENVLDNLKPPICLRNLSIRNYMGARPAIWMNNVNLISNLENIKLGHCLECESLIPFGQLRFLKSLFLRNMPKVKWLNSKFNGNDKYDVFPLLEVLCITKLKALEDWFEAGVAAEDGCLFPCLIQLKIDNCPKLKELPYLPPKLKFLEMDKTGWTTLNFGSNLNHIPLEKLYVSNCPNITRLPLANEIARLAAALRSLIITKCPNLISLGEMPTTSNNCHLMVSYLDISDPSVLLMEPLRSTMTSIKGLSISENDELVSVPNEAEQWFLNVSSSLSELSFRNLKSLQSIPSCLESLSSLQRLYIENVPMLQGLPNLPLSLKSLEIYGCHPELAERYGEDGGSDRRKIAHIRYICIAPIE